MLYYLLICTIFLFLLFKIVILPNDAVLNRKPLQLIFRDHIEKQTLG